MLSIRRQIPYHSTLPLHSQPHSTLPTTGIPGYCFDMPVLKNAVRLKRPANTAAAVKAARVIRSIQSRYRTQAFLFLAYHFFLTSFVHLDIFIMLFILVSNFMNREQAFPSQLVIDGVRILINERRFIMP